MKETVDNTYLMEIETISSQFPSFSQDWSRKRLTRYFNIHGSMPHVDDIIGVMDYLTSLTAEDKIHQKLNKVSWKDAVQIQKKWHLSIAKKSAKMKEFGGHAGGKIVVECGEYNWIELKTPEQFDFEGNAMGHCIGKGRYDSSKNRFFSLRDLGNLPHITVEFDPSTNKYAQIQGRANEPVIADYFKYMRPFFDRFGQHNGLERFANGRDFVAVKGGNIFFHEDSLQAIKQNDIVVDAMHLSNKSYGLTVDGKIHFFHGEDIPDGTAFKHVRLDENTNITYWKWDVIGDFIASNSKLKEIAETVNFGGIVDIENTNIKHWYSNVNGNFFATNSKLETIAEAVIFGGNVDISGTRIAHWQWNIAGVFCAGNSRLKTIAEGVKIGSGKIFVDSHIEKQLLRRDKPLTMWETMSIKISTLFRSRLAIIWLGDDRAYTASSVNHAITQVDL